MVLVWDMIPFVIAWQLRVKIPVAEVAAELAKARIGVFPSQYALPSVEVHEMLFWHAPQAPGTEYEYDCHSSVGWQEQ